MHGREKFSMAEAGWEGGGIVFNRMLYACNNGLTVVSFMHFSSAYLLCNDVP